MLSLFHACSLNWLEILCISFSISRIDAINCLTLPPISAISSCPFTWTSTVKSPEDIVVIALVILLTGRIIIFTTRSISTQSSNIKTSPITTIFVRKALTSASTSDSGTYETSIQSVPEISSNTVILPSTEEYAKSFLLILLSSAIKYLSSLLSPSPLEITEDSLCAIIFLVSLSTRNACAPSISIYELTIIDILSMDKSADITFSTPEPSFKIPVALTTSLPSSFL